MGAMERSPREISNLLLVLFQLKCEDFLFTNIYQVNRIQYKLNANSIPIENWMLSSPECSLEGLMLRLKLQYFGHMMRRTDWLEKTLMLQKIEGRREKGTTEDEVVGWHHRQNGHGFWWTPGVGDGQGGLACCDLWGHKESDTTERLKWTELN